MNYGEISVCFYVEKIYEANVTVTKWGEPERAPLNVLNTSGVCMYVYMYICIVHRTVNTFVFVTIVVL